MCMQCAAGAMTAGTAATGATAYLRARQPSWLTPRRLRAATALLLGGAVVAASTVASAAPGDNAKQVTSGETAIWTWGVWLEKPSAKRLCVIHDWALPDSDQKPSARDGADSANRSCVNKTSKGRWPSRLVVASVAGGSPDGETSYEAGGYYGIVPGATSSVRVISTKGKSTKVATLKVFKAPKGMPGVKVFVGIGSPNVHPLNPDKIRLEARSKSGKVLFSKRFVA